MPLFKDYGDNIAKWLNPSPKIENFHQDWRWGSKDVWDEYYPNRASTELIWGYKTEPTLQRSSKVRLLHENVHDGRNCFGLVFGWTSVDSLGIPYIRLSLKKEPIISKKSFHAPMMCFIVFVGGRLLKDIDSVEEMAKAIADNFQMNKPLKYFFESKNGEVPKMSNVDKPRVK